MGPDFAKRQRKIRKLMEKKGLDAILTLRHENIFYYTGYEGLAEDTMFMILPVDGKPELVVSSLANETDRKYPKVVYMQKANDFVKRIKHFKTIGYDGKYLNVLLFKEMEKLNVKLKHAGEILEAPRMTKDAYEIAQMRKAAEITGKVIERISGKLSGKTEKKIADAMEIEFRKLGVSSAFETIVSSGPQTAFIHRKPNERLVRGKDLVLIDAGCKVNGYCADITRMFFKRLDAKQKRIYEDVKQIHDEIIANIRAGVAYNEIEDLQKKLFGKNGYKVMHGFGHGLGLSPHEPAGDVLMENEVITVEPGVYMKNVAGFRIEDVIVVKKKGAEILSKAILIS